MTNAHHQTESEGTQYRLRVSVMDKNYDEHFVRLTSLAHRQHLPGIIMLYSDALMTVPVKSSDVKETYEQKSSRELAHSQFNAYRSRVEQGYRTTKFSLTPESLWYDEELHRLHVRLHLGAVAGKIVIASPYVEPVQAKEAKHVQSLDSMAMHYDIPHPTTPVRMALAIKKMKSLMEERRRGFDELMLADVGENQPIQRAIIRRDHIRDYSDEDPDVSLIGQRTESSQGALSTQNDLKQTG